MNQKVAVKQRLWVEAMLTNGGNATQAAVAAGYKSGEAAKKAGHRMSTNVHVAEMLEKRRAAVLAQAERTTLLTVQEVLEDLAQARRFDPAKMYGEDGRLLPVRDMPPEIRMHLEGVEIDEIAVGRGKDRVVIGHTSKVRFPKKSVAREQAMKHLGLFEKDNTQRTDPIAALFAAIEQRGQKIRVNPR